jgi:hypothetical protein
MTTVNPNHPRVTDSQIYRHASETVRSTNDAGGKVQRHQYENQTRRTPSGGSNMNVPPNEAKR